LEIIQFNEFVIKLLNNKFGQSFTTSDLSNRHYSFSSTEFDFSFPIALTNSGGESALNSKLTRWLDNASEKIESNGHYLFDVDGNVWQ